MSKPSDHARLEVPAAPDLRVIGPGGTFDRMTRMTLGVSVDTAGMQDDTEGPVGRTIATAVAPASVASR